MVGRAPAILPPPVPQTAPRQVFPARPAVGLPRPRPAAPTQPGGALPPPSAVRGKVDTPAPAPLAPKKASPAPLTLPAPEQLGVSAPCAGGAPPLVAVVDWNATHARLRQLGAISVQMVKLSTGGFRFTFLLPTDEPSRTRHVEATGQSEAEAVNLALGSL